jgi:hypothetical protein
MFEGGFVPDDVQEIETQISEYNDTDIGRQAENFYNIFI